MLEQRNAFINEMNTSFISQKKKLNNILSLLKWTPQSVAGTFKEDDVGSSECNLKEEENDIDLVGDPKQLEGRKNVDISHNILKEEGCSFSLIGIQSWMRSHKNRTLCLGTSKDSEQSYNELLASLSFQPKVKQEKLSDTQLLATLLESERNAKRRRISYRNKVHTKNKSQTEVLREVIREQMETLEDTEEHDPSKSSCTSGKKEEEDEMLEVRVMDGNPHLAWQTVGLVVGEQRQEKRKSHDITNKSHRRERRRSSDHSRERSDSNHRKSHHHSKHDRKSHRSSPESVDKANYRHSRQSRSDRSRDREHSFKSSHKSSRKHHSKHKRHDR